MGPTRFYAAGGFLLAVGLLAMVRPGMASLAIAQLIGILCLVSGVALFVSAIFSKARKHRMLELVSAALRLIVGVLLIVKVVQGLLAITILLAAIFIAEGVTGIAFGLRMRGRNPAWWWMLVNAAVAFVLGGMLLANFPADAAWALGLFFGINSAVLGLSLIMFGRAIPRAR